MFGKLRNKLKDALSVFSKKTEEEAQVQEVERVIEEQPVEKKEAPKKETPKKEKKPEPKQETKKEIKKEEKKVEEKSKIKEVKEIEESKPVIEKIIVKEPKVEPEKEEKKAGSPKEESATEREEEKKSGFFSKIKKTFSFGSDDEDEIVETPESEVKEELAEVIKEEPSEVVKEEPSEVIKEEPKVEVTPEEKKVEVSKPEVKEESEKEVKEETEEPEEPKEEKSGFFSRIKKSFTTKIISGDKFEDLFWNLEMVLLENNVSVEVIEKIREDLKDELVDKPLPRDVLGKIQDTLKETMKEILSCESVNLIELIKNKSEKPFVITLFGINGVGKTTSIAKLTHLLQSQGLSVVLAACDTFRAAAIDQLQEHADKLDVKMIRHDYGSDAAAVAYDAIKYAQKNNIDVVMIDTAGRLHSNTNLMAELEKIIRITKPDFKIFVGESITGNDCIEQARKFNDLVQMDGAILTKVDVDEKGGAPLSISYTIKKPILYLGVGQEYKDLEKFDADVILGRLGF